ncbi:MAG: hypothetical protein AAF808_10330 [Cyanobacteria bacterium P01_D01_bin.2]
MSIMAGLFYSILSEQFAEASQPPIYRPDATTPYYQETRYVRLNPTHQYWHQ